MNTFLRKAVIATALVSFAALSMAQERPFKIGALLSFSGAYGVLGQNAKRGVEIALAERGGKVLGRSIVVEWEDTETKPQVAVQKANRMLASGVDTIFGATSSGETLAIMPMIAQAKVPHLVTMSADDRITGANKSRYTFRTSNNLSMENAVLVEEIRTSGSTSFYGIASDVGATREGWSDIRTRLTQMGKRIVGEDFPAFGSKDFAVAIDKVAKSGADTVVVVAAGNDAIGFLKQANEVGLAKRVKILGPVLVDDSAAKAVGSGMEFVFEAGALLAQGSPRDIRANTDVQRAYLG